MADILQLLLLACVSVVFGYVDERFWEMIRDGQRLRQKFPLATFKDQPIVQGKIAEYYPAMFFTDDATGAKSVNFGYAYNYTRGYSGVFNVNGTTVIRGNDYPYRILVNYPRNPFYLINPRDLHRDEERVEYNNFSLVLVKIPGQETSLFGGWKDDGPYSYILTVDPLNFQPVRLEGSNVITDNPTWSVVKQKKSA
ncbi:unnamed protein product [Bursaphelenchus xylophilus]|uniref:(pine wood nematode) hypothetical protein n=1 Tax=Bursaphelenchus xylophilus TaxID=6326 RepID=A0A1I7RMN4_BURXY|nr:unnamed protein product [Bursaphelenchus xylophilus]CAG9125643.1 unnamed protein product [Bursaphelenchus xylophilus]